MAQASLSELSKDAEKAFTDPLGGLRRRIRSWIVIEGLGAVALAVLIWVALDFALDYFFRFDRPQRMALLSIGAFTALFVAWRKLAAPMQTSVTDDALLLRVEQQRKGSNDEMISAWQFAKMPNLDRSTMSLGLIERVMSAGAASARGFDFSSALNRDNQRKSTLRLLASGTALAAFFLSAIFWNPASIWLKRNLLLGNETWPQSTYLEISNAKDGRIRIPRGEDLIVNISVRDDSKVIPNVVLLRLRPARRRNASAAKKTQER